MDQTDPVENYNSIRGELEHYSDELKERPEIVVVTKSELPDAESVRDRLAESTGGEVFLISAVTGSGLPPLLNRINDVLEQHKACS